MDMPHRRAGLALLLLATALAAGSRPEPGRSRLAYVNNLFSGTVSVYDLETMEWRRDFPVGPYPVFSLIRPDDPGRMLVSLHNYERQEDEDALALVELESGKTAARVGYPGAGMPSGFVYDPRRDRLYIADENLHRIFVHDGRSLAILFELPAGLIPVKVDLSADGRWLACTARKSANLYLYDLSKPRPDAKDGVCTVPLGRAMGFAWEGGPESAPYCHPLDVKFAPGGDQAYVTDADGRALLFVDLASRQVTARVPLAASPFDLTLDRAGTLAYVCLVGGDSVAVVDLAARAMTGEIRGLEGNPIHCAIDEDHGLLVISCWSGGIWLADARTRRPLKRIKPEGARGSIGIALALPGGAAGAR